ncbi:dormancy-associated protein homolog 4-like [Benincasa hispida]|uniref:dormancy-associated protein homolog 4-like n=1 Tax=Benincasa hispida TaxID=102211 RepID=UPI0018FFAD92|nr:dormancy-associated protein homolog 4-like [Benincasa hispida]
MSFLQKLWDETLAGPAPDSGLSRLRKYNSFSASRSPPMLSNDVVSNIPPSIQIPSPTLSQNQTSFPESPIASSSTPRTPPSTPPETPRGDDMKRLARRRSIDYPRRRPLEGPEQTSPSVYDWIVITALDR